MWSVWLVFCDVVLFTKLSLVLMWGPMFSKSLIQFSVDGQNCDPSLLLDLRPNYCGNNEDIWDLQKVSWCTAAFSAPNPVVGHSWSRLCQRLLDTHGYIWLTLMGMSASVTCRVAVPFSWVPVHTRFYLCPPRVCFPSSGGSMMGLMATSSKRANTISRSAAPRAPDPAAGHCQCIPPQDILRHSSTTVSVGWTCILCSSQVWAAQVTECSASAPSQVSHAS